MDVTRIGARFQPTPLENGSVAELPNTRGGVYKTLQSR